MLKNNKIPILIAGLAILTIIVLSVLLSGGEKELPDTIDAVPLNPAMILEVEDLPDFIDNLKDNKEFYKKAEKSVLLKSFCKEINFIDSLIKKNKNIKKVLSKNKVLLSTHLIGEKEAGMLYVIGLSSPFFEEKISEFFKANFKDSSYTYDEQTVKVVKTKNENLYYSFCKSRFIMSFSQTLLERSIRQTENGVTISDDNDFISIYKTVSTNSQAALYIKYDSFSELVEIIMNPETKKKLSFLKHLGQWSALDIKLGFENIQITGYTSQESKYLNIFSKQDPQDNAIIDYFPEKSSGFIILGIENGKVFEKNYFDFLASTKQTSQYNERIAKLYGKQKFRFEEFNMYQITGSNMAYLIEDVNKNGKNHNFFAFVNTPNTDEAKRFMNNFTDTTTLNKAVKRLIYNNMLYLHFGDVFAGINERYYTYVDDYMIFSETASALNNLLKTEKKFKNNEENRELLNLISEESNFLSFMDIAHLQNIFVPHLNDEYKQAVSKDVLFLNHIKGPVFQFISGEKAGYSAIQIKLAGSISNKETIWECKLDTTISGKPQIFRNHADSENEIFVQDNKNKIYLISKTGEVIWERQIDGKILGEAQQIDFYKNNKLQIFFNTKKELHLIDRNGNYIEGYPIKIETGITNPVSVFNYDNDRNYRFAFATLKNEIRLVGKDGKPVQGWNNVKTTGQVTKKIKHFRDADKDYIVCSDNIKVYIVNRKGENIVVPTHRFEQAPNSDIYFEKASKKFGTRLVTSNTAGEVIFIYLKDGKVRKFKLEDFSRDHYFIYEDITGDKIPEFIFSDKNEVFAYSQDKSEILSYECESSSIAVPLVYSFSETNKRLGIVSANDGKIFLLDKNQELYSGFPLRGRTEFSITKFDANEDYSVVVGSSSNYLYKYMLF